MVLGCFNGLGGFGCFDRLCDNVLPIVCVCVCGGVVCVCL